MKFKDNFGQKMLEQIQAGGENSATTELIHAFKKDFVTFPNPYYPSSTLCLEDYEEVFHDVLIKFIDKAKEDVSETSKDNRSTLKSYLRKIFYYTCIGKERSRRREPLKRFPETVAKLAPTPLEIIFERESAKEKERLKKALEKAWEDLGDSCKEILSDRYLRREPLSYKEIQKKLGAVSESSVRAQRCHCLSKLAKRFKKYFKFSLSYPP